MVVGASCFHTSKNQMFRLLVQLCVVVIVLRGALVDSFLRPHAAQLARTSCRTSCCYSVLDSLQRAFENPEFSWPDFRPGHHLRAITARHILVATHDEATSLLEQLSKGAPFTTLARDYSTTFGTDGGMLVPTMMMRMPELEAVVMDKHTHIGEVEGPVKTKFGYHLIVVDERHGV